MQERIGKQDTPVDRSEVLTQKLIDKVFKDEDLNGEIGMIVIHLAIIPMYQRKELTSQQFDRILTAMEETTTLGLTPEQIENAEKEAKSYIKRWGDKPSPFSGAAGPF